MTHLRKMMCEELERRNSAQATINSYRPNPSSGAGLLFPWA